MNNPGVNQSIEEDMNGCEITGPLLGDYLTIFLNNAQNDHAQNDARILFYRGQSDISYSLTPSVFRNSLLEKEHVIIQELLLNSPGEFFDIVDSLERLIKMQHYGLPTRLLDVTTNPLVALYFACNGNVDKDGEIIIFYDYMQHTCDKDAKCLAFLADYNGSTERQMLGFLTNKGFTDLELGRLTKLTHIPIKAPLNNERIRRQSGAFVIVGVHGDEDGNPYQKVTFDLKPYVVKDFKDGVSRSIIIPKEDKLQLIKELSSVGINHAFLFPELEHQAMYIQSKYKEV